jgi:hypothetical protein
VPGELIGHADAGSQYTAIRFTEHLDLEGIRPSIGSVGDAYDNALMESVSGLFKTECIRTTSFNSGPYRSLADVEWATAGRVDWYNNRRTQTPLCQVAVQALQGGVMRPTKTPSELGQHCLVVVVRPRADTASAGSSAEARLVAFVVHGVVGKGVVVMLQTWHPEAVPLPLARFYDLTGEAGRVVGDAAEVLTRQPTHAVDVELLRRPHAPSGRHQGAHVIKILVGDEKVDVLSLAHEGERVKPTQDHITHAALLKSLEEDLEVQAWREMAPHAPRGDDPPPYRAVEAAGGRPQDHALPRSGCCKPTSSTTTGKNLSLGVMEHSI